VSDEIPSREEIIRSTLITVILASIFLTFSILFWAWKSLDDSPITFLNDINTFLPVIFEVLILFGAFISLTVTIVNLRLYLTKIRSGWLEIIFMLALIVIIAYAMFTWDVAVATLLLSLGFIAYLYLLQD
jgi:hypothetical protein